MKPKRCAASLAILALCRFSASTYAQNKSIAGMFSNLRTKASAGQVGTDEADSVLEQLPLASRVGLSEDLPLILQEAHNPYPSLRRIAAVALWEISRRADGVELLGSEADTMSTLLVDPDIPVRRVTILTIYTLWPSTKSPMVPHLRSYLAREDAIETIGPAVAGVLMKTVPDDAESMRAVVQFMHRPNQTAESLEGLLISVGVAKCHNPDVAKEVARYAKTADEQLSVLALETLGGMGKGAVLSNQQAIVRLAGDVRRPQDVRATAAKALLAAQ